MLLNNRIDSFFDFRNENIGHHTWHSFKGFLKQRYVLQSVQSVTKNDSASAEINIVHASSLFDNSKHKPRAY